MNNEHYKSKKIYKTRKTSSLQKHEDNQLTTYVHFVNVSSKNLKYNITKQQTSITMYNTCFENQYCVNASRICAKNVHQSKTCVHHVHFEVEPYEVLN